MATVTARILQSQGLEAAVGSLATREVGLTSDTERPVIGTTVGGPKFIGTEGLTLITTVAPSALTTHAVRTMAWRAPEARMASSPSALVWP